jgi:hypothetical protein
LAALSGEAIGKICVCHAKQQSAHTLRAKCGCRFITGDIAGFGVEPVAQSLNPFKSVFLNLSRKILIPGSGNYN